MTIELVLDSSGGVWLHRDADGRSSATLLGRVDEPGTSYRVPAELLDRLAELEAEWADMREFGAAARGEAIRSYWRGR